MLGCITKKSTAHPPHMTRVFLMSLLSLLISSPYDHSVARACLSVAGNQARREERSEVRKALLGKQNLTATCVTNNTSNG